jgi:Zn-dependent protease with chaperone function
MTLSPLPALASDEDRQLKLDGYAEWREGGLLIVDGQRLALGSGARFKPHERATDFAAIPLGYEVKAKGYRDRRGVLVATEIEAKPNKDDALFEHDLSAAFDEVERKFVSEGRMWEEDEHGNEEDYGRLRTRGRDVERVRGIVDELVPSYLDPEDFRVYVVENDEWNAMAGPNGAIFVFTGLLDAMDDDELALILGHELVHATHEHSRKEFKRAMFAQLVAAGIATAAEEIGDKGKRQLVQLAGVFAALAWQNGYGRSHEDQADRVGLRYAFEAGYDVSKAPELWERFAGKYGHESKLVNFFFSDHAASHERAIRLRRELALNYAIAAR